MANINTNTIFYIEKGLGKTSHYKARNNDKHRIHLLSKTFYHQLYMSPLTTTKKNTKAIFFANQGTRDYDM